jgi:hypothetical protein
LGFKNSSGIYSHCVSAGDANIEWPSVLIRVGYNLRLVLAWLRMIRAILLALLQSFTSRPAVKSAF